jgi:ABC-2 type transport system permease protein
MLCLAMIGGGSIPLFVMPRWMQTVSSISPFKWAVQALDGAVWRGLTPAQMALPLCVLLGVGVVGFAVGARVFSWSAKA